MFKLKRVQLKERWWKFQPSLTLEGQLLCCLWSVQTKFSRGLSTTPGSLGGNQDTGVSSADALSLTHGYNGQSESLLSLSLRAAGSTVSDTANYNTSAQEFALKFNQTGTTGVRLEMQSDGFHNKVLEQITLELGSSQFPVPFWFLIYWSNML